MTCSPLDWGAYKNDEEVAWTQFESTVASISNLDSDPRIVDTSFVSYREARTYVAILTNEYYTAHGGRFANELNKANFKPAKVLYPGVGSLQYSAKAPMSMVAREYCAKLDAEGEYLPYDSVRKIRARTHKSDGPS
jgi:hypothetical protein